MLGCAFCAGCSAAPDPETGTEPQTSITFGDRGLFDNEDIFSNECRITLGETISVCGGGAWVEGKEIAISEGGVYEVSGELEGGRIRVESTDPVKLILNGAAIRSEGAAIFCGGGKLTVESAEGTENFLFGDLSDENEPAALYVKEALELCGAGTLSVDGGRGNGIVGRDRLEIEDCALTITAEKNGLQADGALTLTGGSLTVTSRDGKGVQAGTFRAAECGMDITSEDDAVHVAGEAVLDSGSFDFSSASGKGLFADGNLTVNGGYFSVVSSGDGLNAVGHTIMITGGAAFINAEGNGLNSGGDLVMTDGMFVIFGPTHDGGGALRCGEGHKIAVSGGTMLALGNAAPAQTPEENYLFETIRAKAGNVLSVLGEDGETLLSIPLPKDAETAVYADGSDPTGLRIAVDAGNVLP